jgi:hypothetical protein
MSCWRFCKFRYWLYSMNADVITSGLLLAERNDDYFSFSVLNYLKIKHGNKTTPQGSERMMISCDTVCTIIQINRQISLEFISKPVHFIKADN